MRRTEFVIQSFDPALSFTGEFGDLAPMPTDDSYGGWSITSVPKRLSLVEFSSRTPLGVTIDFMVDRMQSGDTNYVSHQMDQLERLAGQNASDEDPPICVIDGNGQIPHDVSQNPNQRWVIETLTWDRDNTILTVDQRLLRIAGTIQLRQWVQDQTLSDYHGPAAKNRNKHKTPKTGKGKGKGKGGTYVVKDGDTLVSIASRQLGDSKRWKEIADLNNIRNPRDLKVGRRLRMPK